MCNVASMSTNIPNRHGKGTREGGRFAPDETPAVNDVDTLTLDSPDADVVSVDPVADLYDKMTYDADGYDGQGFDRRGFNTDGDHRNGYNRYGYDRDGFDRGGNRRS